MTNSRRQQAALWFSLFFAGLAAPTALAEAKLGVTQCPADLAKEIGLAADSGANVLQVATNSPAGKAGLQPGDCIIRINETPIKNFGNLRGFLGAQKPGTDVTIAFRRGGEEKTGKAKLSLWIGSPTEQNEKDALKHLAEVKKRHDGPIIRARIAELQAKIGLRKEAIDEIGQAMEKFPENSDLKAQRLELLKEGGEYDRFASEAIALADKHPKDARIQENKIEALIATGRFAEAEKLAEQQVLATPSLPKLFSAEPAKPLFLWCTARIRQGKSLEHPQIGPKVKSGIDQHPMSGVFSNWKKLLAGRTPYVLEGTKSGQLKFEKSAVLFGLVPQRMHGIKIRINGVEVPLAIVDTGASHTLISERTAKRARVVVGDAERAASGSLPFTAKPGLIRELSIGDLTIKDVPINVGNPPPMVMTKAEVALGIDLMCHLRFVLDYPNETVHVESNATPLPTPANPDAIWDIPLWPFAEHCLARGKTANGDFARILIDSGNFAYTIVWPTWAKGHIAGHPGAAGSVLTYAMTNPQRAIKGLELGGKTLPDWPTVDLPPVALQGVEILDLLMGHDLLSQYKVTVDLANRRLRLESPGGSFKPPIAKDPLAF